MAPLVVLVGRNNSGKSYLASLLWSLFDIENSWLEADEGAPDIAPDWFNALIEESDHSSVADVSLLQEWLNERISAVKNKVVRRLLSYEDVEIGDISLELDSSRKCLFSKEQSDQERDYIISRGRSDENGEMLVTYSVGDIDDVFAKQFVGGTLIVDAVEGAMFGYRGFSQSKPVYLPAARTGLMLSLPFIVGHLLGNLGVDKNDRESTRLPLPTIEFLRQLVQYKVRSDPELVAIAEFLESDLLCGKIGRDESTSPTFSYTPEAGVRLPLHTASSMVSELAPLLILLRSFRLDRGLIFEEPESHLHLSAQRQLARAVARLVNLGVPVVLTTHSDTFIQQINILVSLYGHRDREQLMTKYGYTEEDLINPQTIRGYEFISGNNGRSRVMPVPALESGLVVSSLNDVLIELSEEAIATQEH